MGNVLTPEELNALLDKFVHQLIDKDRYEKNRIVASHEALRADLAVANKTLDEAKRAAWYAFVEGAKWFSFYGPTGATMFPSERHEAEEEATKRYPYLPHLVVEVLQAELAAARAEVERLKGLIDRDRTGLAHALSEVLSTVKGYSWLPDGDWGCFDWKERTETTLRKEIGYAFTAITRLAADALHKSGLRADVAFRGGTVDDTALAADAKGGECEGCKALRAVLTEVLAASRSTYHLERDFGPLVARATTLAASPSTVLHQPPGPHGDYDPPDHDRYMTTHGEAANAALAAPTGATNGCDGTGYIPSKRYDRDYPAMKRCPGCPACIKSGCGKCPLNDGSECGEAEACAADAHHRAQTVKGKKP